MKVFDKKWVMALGMALGLLVGSATVWGHPDQWGQPNQPAYNQENLYAHASALPDPLSLDHSLSSFVTNVAVDPSGPYPPHQGTRSFWDDILQEGSAFLINHTPDVTAWISDVFGLDPNTKGLMDSVIRSVIQFASGGMASLLKRGAMDKA